MAKVINEIELTNIISAVQREFGPFIDGYIVIDNKSVGEIRTKVTEIGKSISPNFTSELAFYIVNVGPNTTAIQLNA